MALIELNQMMGVIAERTVRYADQIEDGDLQTQPPSDADPEVYCIDFCIKTLLHYRTTSKELFDRIMKDNQVDIINYNPFPTAEV